MLESPPFLISFGKITQSRFTSKKKQGNLNHKKTQRTEPKIENQNFEYNLCMGGKMNK